MSETMVTVTPQIPTIVRTCPARGCKARFEQGTGMVPATGFIYEQSRGKAEDPTYPLTRMEVLQHELCHECAKDIRFGKYGIPVFSTAETLSLIERQATRNARQIEEERRERYRREAIEAQRSRAWAEHSGPRRSALIVGALASFKEVSPRAQHRKHVKVTSGYNPATSPKKFGDEHRHVAPAGETKRKKKGKKGGEEQKKGGKGKK